jgi:glucose/mannose transport system permease protein
MTAKTLPQQLSRFAVYAVLLLAAAFFLAPLYVMLATSFKDADEIRQGNLLSLPHGLNFDAWSQAWSEACTGTFSGTRC